MARTDRASTGRSERAATLVTVRSSPRRAGIGVPISALADDELVELARSDADAFAELYRRWLPRIHAFAYRRTGDRSAAEDICSATFERALDGLSRYRRHPAGPGPWLYRIATNETIAFHRREARPRTARGRLAVERLHETRSTGEDVGALVAGRVDADLDALRHALDRLPARYQRALALTHLAELDATRAAAALGIAKPAYAVVLSRARRALRRELERLTEHGSST